MLSRSASTFLGRRCIPHTSVRTCSTCAGGGGGGGDDRDQFKVDVFEDPEVRPPHRSIRVVHSLGVCGGGGER